MKKIAKLSLAAAVAVAGLTTTSSAASLEEAIQGVDVSGQFRYRYQERKVENNGDNRSNSDVEIEVGVKVPVNDNVTAVFKIDNANDDGDTANTKAEIEIEDYYFQYNKDSLTVNAGQQNIPGRMTDGAQGDGLVALYSMGNITLGAASFANHTVNDDDKTDPDNPGIGDTPFEDSGVNSVIAMGNVGPVSLLGQYAVVADTMDSYNLKADVTVDMITAGLEYTATELDSEANTAINGLRVTNLEKDDRDTFKAYVSGNMGIVSAKLSYAKTGDNGSGAIDSQIDSEGLETPSEFLLWNLGTSNNADMDVIALDTSVAVTDKISLRAAYADGEIGNGDGSDVNELLGQVTYKMSKNLTTYVRYATFDNRAKDDDEGNRGRVEVRYTF
ncbi:MAG: porin [Campylobacterota bacterium]